MHHPIEPLTPDEQERVIRWAYVWFALARQALVLNAPALGRNFMDVGEEIFIRLEAAL